MTLKSLILCCCVTGSLLLLNNFTTIGIVKSPLPAYAENSLDPVCAGAYAIIHYCRDDGDYGDHTTGNYNDFWGLHLWGDIEETIEWTAPKPFLGEDEYGRFIWVKLTSDASNVGFIVHRGDTKDGTDVDRFFDPKVSPEIWLRQDDSTTYSSQAEAQGFVTVHYHRADGNYGDPTSADFNDFWGLHLWGEAITDEAVTNWTSPQPFDGIDDYGAFWQVPIKAVDFVVYYIIHRGDDKDPGPDQSFIPFDNATVWIQSGDDTIYHSRGAAENTIMLHYHRADGDYGDPTSADFNDFWGMHVWNGAANQSPSWFQPLKPNTMDIFGPVFNVPLISDATELAYILHRGDEKDPGPDQFLILDKWDYEVWQLEGEGPIPDEPHYVLPIAAYDDTSDTTPPVIECNVPTTITPPDAPISFNATAIDNCDAYPSVEIVGYECFFFTKKGKRIDKKMDCIVVVNENTVTIVDSGGVNDIITWTVRANDNSGNGAESTCSVNVVKPGN